MQKNLISVFRLLASLKLTFALVAILAATLAGAAFLEGTKGIEWVQWRIYGNAWFAGLLGLLIVNIAGATLIRSPWRGRRLGLAFAAVGLLVTLAGFLQTSLRGIEGRLILRKGETASSVNLIHRSQLTLLSRRGQGVQTTELGFSPGPADWRSDEPLDFGEVDGVGVKVLQFYRHAAYEAGWVADEAGVGEPAIQLGVADSQSGQSTSRWCVPTRSGHAAGAGEQEFSIHRAAVLSFRDDFLHPVPVKPGSLGVLSAHYKDRAYPISVDENKGKKIPVGESGLAVEIVDYYANAMSKQGQFVSRGTEPKNPMLLLRVHAPGEKQPVSEIAYANKPFVTFESIKNQECPVKFWYHHPAVTAPPQVEFLQTPDGRLYCRVGVNGVYQPRGEVNEGDRIGVSDDREVSLLRHLPHARPEGIFTSIESPSGDTAQAEAAALVELTKGDKSERFWVRRNDARLGVRKLQLMGEPLIVMFGYEKYPLGFSVNLADFQRDTNPERSGDAGCLSQLRLFKETKDLDDGSVVNESISTKASLHSGGFTFHQCGSQHLPNNIDLSILRVTSDPGRPLKYAGGAMIFVGMLLVIFRRGFSGRPESSLAGNGTVVK